MSRTHRRTNAEHIYWGPKQIEDVSKWDIEWAGLNSAQAYLAQRRASFHRDSHSGRYGVPRHFRNRLNRIARHDARAEIIRHRQLDCWEGHLPQRSVSNAGWLWF